MPSSPPRLVKPRPPERVRTKRQSSLPPHLARNYSKAAWTRRSKAQREAEPLCRACKARGRITPATVADHIVPATDDQSFWHGELQSLCSDHHQAKRQAESQGKEWKPRMGCDASGQSLDPDHPWNHGRTASAAAADAIARSTRTPFEGN